MTAALGARGLNLWTTREIPGETDFYADSSDS